MKLIIDISEELYQMCKNCLGDADCIESAIAHGTPLDDVVVKIEKARSFHVGTPEDDNPIDYGVVIGFDKALKILDNIGKADFPQAEDIEPTVKGFVDTMDILDRICEGRKDE